MASNAPAGARWLVPPPVPGRAPEPLPGSPDPVSWPRAISRGVAVGLLTVLVGMVFWSVAPTLAGWRAQVVLTGSMRNRIAPGDLVLAAPLAAGQLQPGRVILFRDPAHPGRTIVHRLVRFNANGDLVTKGDANQSEDSTPVSTTSVLGLPRLRVPYIGLPVVWMREGDTRSLIAATTVLGLWVLLVLWPVVVPARKPSPAAGASGTPPGSGTHRR